MAITTEASQSHTHTHTIVHCGTKLPVVDHPCPPLVVLPQHSSLLLFRQGHTKVGVEAALEMGACKWRERETGGNACTSCVHSATTTLEDRDSETTGHGWKLRGCLWVLYTVGRLVSQIMYVLYGDIFGMLISLWVFVGGSHRPFGQLMAVYKCPRI